MFPLLLLRGRRACEPRLASLALTVRCNVPLVDQFESGSIILQLIPVTERRGVELVECDALFILTDLIRQSTFRLGGNHASGQLRSPPPVWSWRWHNGG